MSYYMTCIYFFVCLFLGFEGLGMDSIGLYIILPLVSLLLFCIAAGIIIYKRRVQK